ncbi:MAG: hypothetical protein ABEJ80_02685 [Halarchaeum sp.]
MTEHGGWQRAAYASAGRLKRLLGSSPYVSRAAWHVGELTHRWADGGANAGASRPRGVADRHAGPTAPTYPYGAPDDDPLAPAPAPGVENPVLSARDVTDFGAVDLVADPFLLPADDAWHLFFEVYNGFRTPTAAIGHATSADGRTWTYDRIVLETDAHLSFPYVFRWEGEHYMVPDAWSRDPDNPADVTLYRAERFPYDWTPVSRVLAPDRPRHDCVLFRWKGRWWALLGDGDSLYAYHADDLTASDWTPHAANPVVTDRPRAGRPAGRPVVREDGVLVFLQQSVGGYGECVRGYRITDLTPTTYADEPAAPAPVVAPTGGFGWNSGYMHHVDPWADADGTWWCAVDGSVGFGSRALGAHHWAIGLYRAPPR